MLSIDDIEDECRIISESGDSATIEVINNPHGHNHVIVEQVSGNAPNPGRGDIQADGDGLVVRWAEDEYGEEQVEWRIRQIE